jgi:hypothetical protein
MKAAVQVESYDISSFFTLIHKLQRCLLTIARYVSLSLLLINVFFINKLQSTSQNLHLIFFPFPTSCLATPWWHLPKTLMSDHLYLVFTYIYSLHIKKSICDC